MKLLKNIVPRATVSDKNVKCKQSENRVMDMSSACPGSRPPWPTRGIVKWVEQSPLGQMILNEKSPWYPPHITGIHLTEGSFLWYIVFGVAILLIRVRLVEAI